MVHQLSAGGLVALRDVLAVLFIKSHCLSASEFVIFMNDSNRQVISLELPDSEAR